MKTNFNYADTQVLLMQDIPVFDPDAPIDLVSIASDLRDIVTSPDNRDLSKDFKASVELYSGDPQAVDDKLQERRQRCIDEPKQWQSLVAVMPRPEEESLTVQTRQLVVVGLGAVSIAPKKVVPEGNGIEIDPLWPNVSLFVDARHRRHGVARSIVDQAIEQINTVHDGAGWSSISPENFPSIYLMMGAGFKYVGHKRINSIPKNHFVYDNRPTSA